MALAVFTPQGEHCRTYLSRFVATGPDNSTALTATLRRLMSQGPCLSLLRRAHAVVLPNGDKDLSRITASTRVIAIDTPNTNSIDSKWQTYVTPIDAIEAVTGYDLLSNVPTSIQKVLEARVDAN